MREKETGSQIDNKLFPNAIIYKLTIREVLTLINEKLEKNYNPLSVIIVLDREGKERLFILNEHSELDQFKLSESGHIVLNEKADEPETLLDEETTHMILNSLLKL